MLLSAWRRSSEGRLYTKWTEKSRASHSKAAVCVNESNIMGETVRWVLCGQLGRDVAAVTVWAGCSALIRHYQDERRRPGITCPLSVIQHHRHTHRPTGRCSMSVVVYVRWKRVPYNPHAKTHTHTHAQHACSFDSISTETVWADNGTSRWTVGRLLLGDGWCCVSPVDFGDSFLIPKKQASV